MPNYPEAFLLSCSTPPFVPVSGCDCGVAGVQCLSGWPHGSHLPHPPCPLALLPHHHYKFTVIRDAGSKFTVVGQPRDTAL